MEKNNFAFMAFSKGKESVEGISVKRYIGVAPVYVLAVNPDKKQLESLYNSEIEKEPEYIGKVKVDETEYESVRITFIVKTDAKECGGIELVTPISLFLRKSYKYNRDRTKIQVIDKYGRTAWPTVEQAKAHEIPIYGNGKYANIDKDYRPAFYGEEELTNFLKAYLNIPNVMKYVNEQWVIRDNVEDCEARLERILDYFKGDFSEIKELVSLQPKNKVKVLFGVKITDGKQYQDIYTKMFLKNSATNYGELDKNLQENKSHGAYPSTEFEVKELEEYVVKPTEFKEDFPSDLPWD